MAWNGEADKSPGSTHHLLPGRAADEPKLIWSRIGWSAARGTSGTNRFFELRMALSWAAGNLDAEKSLVPRCREACCLVEQWRGRLPRLSICSEENPSIQSQQSMSAERSQTGTSSSDVFEGNVNLTPPHGINRRILGGNPNRSTMYFRPSPLNLLMYLPSETYVLYTPPAG